MRRPHMHAVTATATSPSAIVKLPPRRVRYDTLLATGEDIRRSLEARIDGRDGDAEPVATPP